MASISDAESHACFFRDRLLWLSLLCGGFFVSLTLWYGLGGDQAVCSYAAFIWCHFGKAPYIGVWDHNFPGIFLIHRLALALFGTSTLGFRIFDFLVTMSELGMIFYLAKRLSGSGMAGFMAAVIYSIYYFGLGDWNTAQRESYVFWLLLSALVIAFASEKMIVPRSLAVGLLAGFAFLVKPTYGLSWPIFGLLFLVQDLRRRKTRVWIDLPFFILGCFLPTLLFINYYRVAGQDHELYNATVWFNLAVFDRAYHANFFGKLSTFYLIFSEDPLNCFAGCIALLILLRGTMRSRERELLYTLMALVASAIISIQVQAKNLPYHRIPFWGFFLIFSGAGWGWIGSQLAKDVRRGLARLDKALLYAGVITLTVANTNFPVLQFAVKHAYRNPQESYLSSQTSISSDYKAAEWLRLLLRPGDEISLFGWHPLIPLLLEKDLPSRFCCIQFLYIHPVGGMVSERQKSWMREYSESVIKARTRFFIISDHPLLRQAVFDLTQGQSEDFPGLSNYLREHYKLINTIDSVKIYEAK